MTTTSPAPAASSTERFRTLGELLDAAARDDGKLPGLMGYPAQLRQRYCQIRHVTAAESQPCAACGSLSVTFVDGVPLHLGCGDPSPATLTRLAAAVQAPAESRSGMPGDETRAGDATTEPAPEPAAQGAELIAGVLAADGLWVPGAAVAVPVAWPRNAGEAYALAREHRIRQLWIHPSAHGPLGLPDTHGDNPQAPEQHNWMTADGIDCDPPGLAAWVNLRPPGGERRRALMFAAYERADRADWKQASTGKVLLAAVEEFNRQMPRGCYYYYSPNEVSGAVILHHDRGKLAPVRMPPPATARIRHISRWSRPLGSLEEGATWLHAYDTNAQQLATWNVKLGQGPAEHWPAPQWTAACRRIPGYWLTRRPEDWRPDASLPDLFIPWQRAGERAVWLPTPYLELLDELGAPVTVDEAWAWPVSSAWLEAAGKTFKQARAALTGHNDDDEPARIALTVIKQTYASRIGDFAPHDQRPERRAELVRHDVRDMIISKSFCNDYRRELKIGKQSARWPVAIYADTVYYASGDPDPVKSAPAGLVIGTGLGEYSTNPSDSIPVGVVASQLGEPGFQRAVDRYRRGPN